MSTDDDLMPVTTYVPQRLVPAFQVKAADWVASGGLDDASDAASPGFASDDRPDWGMAELPLARLLHRKVGQAYAGQILSLLVGQPGQALSGADLAKELKIPAVDEVSGLRKVAGCWGHVGRYCNEAKTPLPFQWNEERGYWVTEATAELLRQAGF